MTNQTTISEVRNGTVILPRTIQKQWERSKIVILPSEDSVYIKKITPPSLSELEPKLKKAGKLISQKDINEAVKSARKKVYQGRS